MHKLRQYLQPRPRYRVAVWTATSMLLAVAGTLAFQTWAMDAASRKMEESIVARRAALQPKPAPAPTRAELELQRRWTSLDAERSFAWYPVFVAIEQAGNDKIELLEFEPDKFARRLVLRGEARDLASLFAFVEALSAQPAFRKVYLVRQKNKVNAALTTMEFELHGQMH